MVIYVAILTAISVVTINMLLSFTKSYQTLEALRVAEHSGIDTMERITREVRDSGSVDLALSTLNNDYGVLTLISNNGVQKTVKFYTDNGVVKMNVNGVYFGPLTTVNASTTSFKFRVLNSGISSAVKIDMSVAATIGTVVKTKNYHSTIILRGK